MCKFCGNNEILLQKDVISEMSFGWGNIKISRKECLEYPLSVFIDRGYLRLVNSEDCECIDGGEKIIINFCPICGEKINKNK